MTRLLVLGALAALAVAEVAAVLALVDALGPAVALTILAADMLVGVLVMRWAARGPAAGRGWRITGGAFIALPGLVLDLVGLALLVPGVQRWLQARVMAGTEQLLRRQGMTVVTVTDASGAQRTTVVPGDVIPGTVADPDEQTGTAGPTAHTDQAGREDDSRDGPPYVIRGEIEGPEDPPTT